MSQNSGDSPIRRWDGHKVWASVVAFLGALGALSYIMSRDLEQEQYLWISGSILAPTLGTIYNIFQNRRIIREQEHVADTVQNVEKQTNGQLDARFVKLEEQLKREIDKVKSLVVSTDHAKEVDRNAD